uniref:Uncharacterized protein Pa5G0030 n=1 Tax=Podospora anserina TaxID=2587412 RepID=Q875E0_PODAS|nr:unnamed protein product [Podospora anserina]
MVEPKRLHARSIIPNKPFRANFFCSHTSTSFSVRSFHCLPSHLEPSNKKINSFFQSAIPKERQQSSQNGAFRPLGPHCRGHILRYSLGNKRICSLWSLLVLGYVAMTPRFAPRLFHGTISLAVLCLTTIFWFAGAIAYSVWAGYPYCHGSIWCGSNQAGIAFSWILFVLFTFLAVVETLRFRRGSVRTGPAVV